MVEKSGGFKAVVSRLSLADLMLLKHHIKFTGCIMAEYGDLGGAVYIVDGVITHAETGDESGEEAINQISAWPLAAFSIHAGMISADHTIDKHNASRIMEALQHANHAAKTAQTTQQSTERRSLSSVAAKLREVDSVAYAVVHDKQGTPLQDSSIEATVLAGKGLFLAAVGNRIGDITGLGEVKVAAVQTQDFDQLMYYSKQHYLSIAIAPDSNLDREEGKIRTVLVTEN